MVKLRQRFETFYNKYLTLMLRDMPNHTATVFLGNFYELGIRNLRRIKDLIDEGKDLATAVSLVHTTTVKVSDTHLGAPIGSDIIGTTESGRITKEVHRPGEAVTDAYVHKVLGHFGWKESEEKDPYSDKPVYELTKKYGTYNYTTYTVIFHRQWLYLSWVQHSSEKIDQGKQTYFLTEPRDLDVILRALTLKQ